jgi:hypothetical protein
VPGTTHNYARASCWAFSSKLLVFASLLGVTNLMAQRVFEKGENVVYEDVGKHRINLGKGLSPVLTADGKVALIRGRRFFYGEEFDCRHTETKNWIALYDPLTTKEKTIFNRSLDYDRDGIRFCIFEQIQLSHDVSTLYLVSPVYATSGSLAIVNLARGAVTFIPGVNEVYVIETGPHRDELIYVRRTLRKRTEDDIDSPTYPFIHARANGDVIAEISNESFTVGGNDKVPLLRAYLRKLDGTITVNGRSLP